MLQHSFKILVSCLALALALLAVGCGGGDDTSDLTKAQFIKQADAICKKADTVQLEEMKRVGEEIPGASKPSAKLSKANQEKWIIEGGLPTVQKQAEEIADLGAPSGDEEQIDAIIEGMEEGVKTAEADPLNSLETAFVQVDKLSKKYGFKECTEAL